MAKVKRCISLDETVSLRFDNICKKEGYSASKIVNKLIENWMDEI